MKILLANQVEKLEALSSELKEKNSLLEKSYEEVVKAMRSHHSSDSIKRILAGAWDCISPNSIFPCWVVIFTD